MHVEIIETSPLEREVQIAVEPNAVESEVAKALNQLKGRVKVKGFRPGKVPRRELARRYGKSVRRDVMKTLIQSTLSDALRREDLKGVLHVSPPEVVDDSGSGGFSYRFKAEVRPEITPTGYLGMGIEVDVEPVEDADIDTEIDRLRRQHAIVEPVEDREVAEAEDWVTISYRRLGDEGDDKPSDIGVDLTEDTLPASMKDAIVGLKVGETTTTTLSPDSPDAELPDGEELAEADEPVELEVTLQAIKKRTLPEADDELAEMVGDFDGIQALRDEIKNQLEARREQQHKAEMRRQVEDKLIEQADFEVPPAFLDTRLDDEVRNRLQMFDQRMQQPDPALVGQLREQVRPDVIRRVQLEFLLGAIAEREKVAASDADIDRAIEELVRPAGAHAATLRQLYQKPSHRTALRERVRLDKTLDFLLAKATIFDESTEATDAASEADSSQSAEKTDDSAATVDSQGEADGD